MRTLPEVSLGFEAEHAASIAYSSTDDLRRTMRKGIGKSLHGWHPSPKVGMTEFVGHAQAQAMRVLDLRTDVASYRTWPVEVRFSDSGRPHSWVPDLGIRFRDGRRLVLDLLSRREAELFRQHRLHELVARTLSARDIVYVAREREAFAASRPCLNADYTQRFRVAGINRTLATDIEDLLAGRQRRTLADLVTLLPSARAVTATACAMAWAGRLSLGLDALEPEAMTVELAGATP